MFICLFIFVAMAMQRPSSGRRQLERLVDQHNNNLFEFFDYECGTLVCSRAPPALHVVCYGKFLKQNNFKFILWL
jgi:hypothetical protein